MAFAVSLCLLLFAGSFPAQPNFLAYPAEPTHLHRLATPQLRTAEERRFRTVLRNAVSRGHGVVDGGTEHERPGPNFAGNYLLVQWGCGLECTMAALIDGRTGKVLRLPDIPGSQTRATVQLGTAVGDLRALQFRRESRLLGIPSRIDDQIHFYVLQDGHWSVVGTRRIPSV